MFPSLSVVIEKPRSNTAWGDTARNSAAPASSFSPPAPDAPASPPLAAPPRAPARRARAPTRNSGERRSSRFAGSRPPPPHSAAAAPRTAFSSWRCASSARRHPCAIAWRGSIRSICRRDGSTATPGNCATPLSPPSPAVVPRAAPGHWPGVPPAASHRRRSSTARPLISASRPRASGMVNSVTPVGVGPRRSPTKSAIVVSGSCRSPSRSVFSTPQSPAPPTPR